MSELVEELGGNNIIEIGIHVEFCPYCGSKDIVSKNEVSCGCTECGRDFTVVTHE